MNSKDVYPNLVGDIIRAQEKVIGPLALDIVTRVNGLQISADLNSISIKGDQKKVLSELVDRYESLFGKASVEVCKDAVRPLVAKMKDVDLPNNLL